MRFTWAVLTILLLVVGCASKPASTAEGGDKPAKNQKEEKPEVLPLNEVSGKVVLVNDSLRYVVIDFGFGRYPEQGQRLSVFHHGNKVAEVRISSQSRNSNFAADIIVGIVKNGDEVKQ